MKQQNRLKKRKQFNWTFKNGTSIHSKDLTVVFTTSWAKDFKVGFSVSKKVGKAVVRNKIRRRLREIITQNQQNILEKRTIIIVAKPTVVDLSFEELKSQVVLILKKAKLLK